MLMISLGNLLIHDDFCIVLVFTRVQGIRRQVVLVHVIRAIWGVIPWVSLGWIVVVGTAIVSR